MLYQLEAMDKSQEDLLTETTEAHRVEVQNVGFKTK